MQADYDYDYAYSLIRGQRVLETLGFRQEKRNSALLPTLSHAELTDPDHTQNKICLADTASLPALSASLRGHSDSHTNIWFQEKKI